MKGPKKDGPGYLQTIESEEVIGTESCYHADYQGSFKFGNLKVDSGSISSVGKGSIASNGDFDDLVSRVSGTQKFFKVQSQNGNPSNSS